MKIIVFLFSILWAAAAAAFTVEAEWRGDLFVAKHRIYRLEHYRLASDPAVEGIWRLNGQEIGRGTEITLARPVDAPAPEVCDAADPEAGWISVTPPQPDGGKRPYDCDVALRWFVPELLYDDELRDFDWEVATKLPAPCRYRITVTPDRDNALFPAQTLELELQGHHPDDRFGAGEYRKSRVWLHGKELLQPLTVEWVVAIPGLELCRERLRFVPAEMLPELTAGEDGHWYDESGTRIIPVLHRKILSEQRTLELARSVGRSALSKRRVLVLSEEFGSAPAQMFGPELRDALIASNYELIFVPWFPGPGEGEEWGQALPRALEALRSHPADQVVIVPPGNGRRPRLRSDEEWVRLTDLLLHAAWAQPEVKRVILTTPLFDPAAPESTGYTAGLRQLLRGTDAELFEFAARFESLPGWRDRYRPAPGNTAEYHSSPSLAAKELARLLARAVTGW